MKKTISALLGVMLVLLLVSPAAGEALTFTAGEYPRNPQNSMGFSYQAAEMEHCTVAIADHPYVPQEDAARLAEWVEEDAALLWNAFDGAALTKPTVYLVWVTDRNGPYAQGNALFCGAEDIFTDRYQVALMQAMLGTESAWLAHGCVANARCGENSVSGIAVWAMYYMANDPGILNLLPTRFYPGWNTEDALFTADAIAMSLVNDIITYDGVDKLTEEPSPERLAAWRGRMHFPKQTEREKADTLRRLSYSFGSEDDLIVTSAHQRFAFEAGDAMLEDAAAMEDFLYSAVAGRDFLVAYLAENASADNAEHFAANLDWINCKARPAQEDRSSSFRYPDTVSLYEYYAYTHEMVHGMLGKSDALQIIKEGLCMYFDLLQPQSAYAALIRQTALEPDSAPAWRVGDELYLDMMGAPAEEAFDMHIWMDALSLYAMQNPDSEDAAFAIKSPLTYQAYYRSLSEPGANLSYVQGCSLVYYLIDQYGLDTVLTYVRENQTLMGAYGKTFNMLQKEWRLYLRESAGA